MIQAEKVKPQGKVPYLWRNKFPEGCISVLAGMEGSCKSILTAAIAAEVSKVGAVIFCNEEDPLRLTRSRITVAGGKLTKVFFPETGYNFPDDLERFEEDVQTVKPKLCVFDAASQHLPYLSNEQACRKALNPLAWLAEEYKMAILFVNHSLRTASRGKDIKQCIQGPALTRAARVLAIMGELPPLRPGIATPNSLRAISFVKDSFREKPQGMLLTLETQMLAGASVAKISVAEDNVRVDPYELLGAGSAVSAWQPRRRST